MPIVHDEARRLWLVSTPGSTLAFGLDDDDVLRHIHWGAPLTADQAALVGEISRVRRHPFETPEDGVEEYAVAGGLRFGAAALDVCFADGTRGLELAYQGQHNADDELTVRFADRHYPLEVDLHYRIHPSCDVIERWTELRHTGTSEAITVVRADSATWVLPSLGSYRFSQLRGRWGEETRLQRGDLPYGETVITSRRGVTSHHANPWVLLDDGTAAETHGEVWSAALAWSGSWRITTQRLPNERVSVNAGFGHDGCRLRLLPGESRTTPVSAGMFGADGFGGAARAWHGHIHDHVLPHPEEDRPVLYNSWEATKFAVSEANQWALAERAARIGVELFVVDDGWFGARADDTAGLGDWTVNAEKFPRGLGPLIDHVHGLGMKFGLWVEPENVNPNSDLYRSHPDWVLHFTHRRRSESRNQLVLDLARPDVAAWMHGWLDRLLDDNAIDFLKWDMNRPMSEVGDPTGTVPADHLWTDYVTNLYGILDRLRADHPRVRVESCSAGGGRVDLGILARTDQVWTSDNTDAVDRLDIQHGFGQIYPARIMTAWVTDSPNFLTGRTVPLRFRFHAAMAGVLGIGGHLSEWSEEELDEAAEHVRFYKSVRPVIQHGRQFHLDDGEAVEYVAGADVVVLVRRRARRGPERPVRLRGIDPAADYRDQGSGSVYPGAVLAAHGLPIDLPTGDYASTAVWLRRV